VRSAQDSRPALLLVDDHVAVAHAIVSALRMEGFGRIDHVPAHALDLDGILAAADRVHPQVALVDLYLGAGRSGLAVIGPLTSRGVVVLAFTASDDPIDAALCLEAGAVAVVLKTEPFDQLVDCITKAAAGEPVTDPADRHEALAALRAHRATSRERHRPFESLTPTERAVLGRLVAGRSPHDIADDHAVSIKTVRSHIDAIHRKLGVASQLAAAALAREAGWPPTNPARP
jgi:DNA-binding NarL/FixJ family response regulator